jgi:hypothetical protein
MQSDHSIPPSLQAITGVLPVLAAALLVASVAYDYAFLLALGVTLDEIPSSLGEHVRSAVVWAPIVSVAFILYAVVELSLRRIEGGRTEDELVARSPTPKFTRAFRRSGDAALWVGAVSAAAVGPFLSTDNGWMFFSFTVLWGSLTLSVLAHPRLKANFNSVPKRLLLITPVLLSFVCMQGHSAGASLKRSTVPAWDAVVKVGDQTNTHQLFGIRRFTTFAVAVTKERQVWLLPNDAILSLKAIRPLDISTLNACRWWQVLCSPEPKR